MRTRLPAPVRFVATVFGLVLVFGGGTSIVLGAFDKSQTDGKGSLTSISALWHYNLHFLQQTFAVITTAHDVAGTPFHTYLLIGLAWTIDFCFIAMPIALVFGMMLALMSRSGRAIVRVPARAYVEFFRNTPLLVQLLAIYTSLLFLPSWFLNFITAGIATLALNYAAYECENLRAGLAALDRGQGEAAEALGLSYWQSLRHVIFPQIVSISLPPVINDLIYMYKDSSILTVLIALELTAQIKDLSRRSPSLSWEVFVVGALLYLVLSLPLARLARVVETRLKSTTVAFRRDLSIAALQVLGGMVLFGWLCGVLAEGMTLANMLSALGQLLVAFALTCVLLAFTLVVLGGISYVIYILLGIGRGAPRAPEAGSAQPAISVEP